MKLILTILLTLSALNAQAFDWKKLIPIVIGGAIGSQIPASPYPGPGHPGWGQPNYPGQPYPGGNVQCRANDNGWEEHSGGHYSCGECLQYHDGCTETCSSVSVECRVDGSDYSGRAYSFMGRGYDQYAAQNDAIYYCQRQGLNNCYVVSCQQHNDIVSRRDCRR